MGGVERCWKLLVRAVAFTRGGMDRQLDSSRNRLAPSSPTADCVLGLVDRARLTLRHA